MPAQQTDDVAAAASWTPEKAISRRKWNSALPFFFDGSDASISCCTDSWLLSFSETALTASFRSGYDVCIQLSRGHTHRAILLRSSDEALRWPCKSALSIIGLCAHPTKDQGSKKAPARAGVRPGGCAPTGGLGKRHSLQLEGAVPSFCRQRTCSTASENTSIRSPFSFFPVSFLSVALPLVSAPTALHRPIVQFGSCQGCIDWLG